MDTNEKERRAAILVKDYDGIIPYHEVFYLHSINYSAQRCLDSFERYEHNKEQDVSPDYLISTIQEAIGHAAALSRYFWPSTQRKKNSPMQFDLRMARGTKLRKSFGLTNESPLYDRNLRNTWEHFDEGIDAYLLQHDAGIFFPNCTIDTHELADDPVGHIFKLLDPEKECLVLLGNKFFFSPIREEANKILNKFHADDNIGTRFQNT